MNKVNLGEKYTHRMTLRLNDVQYEFLLKISRIMDVTPSDYLRMIVNSMYVSTSKNIDDIVDGKILEKGMVGTIENVKTDCDNIV